VRKKVGGTRALECGVKPRKSQEESVKGGLVTESGPLGFFARDFSLKGGYCL